MLDAQQNLFGKRVQPVEKWLKRYLKSGFILRYERRKEIASDETVISQSVQPFVLTPTLVRLHAMMCDFTERLNVGYCMLLVLIPHTVVKIVSNS